MRWESDNSNELYHYGILGQKWGVRRFQNADGSLTQAGRLRYSLRKEEDVRKEVADQTSENNSEIKRIRALSEEVKGISRKRDQAYKEYYSKYAFNDKQKKELEKVIDSWYGAPLNKSQKESYDYDVHDLIIDEISSPENIPDSLRKIEEEYYDKSREYWKANDGFFESLINKYSMTEVYTTKKGIFGIDIIDKRTKGRDFVEQLIRNGNLMQKLGGTEKQGKYDVFIGLNKHNDHKADKIFDQTVERLAKELNFNWYNQQKLKEQS